MPMTARLLAISDRRALGATGLDGWLEALRQAGVEAVQLRDKELDDRDLYALARRARALLPAPVRLLVNGRLDVALAAGADGAHLPADGVPLAALRRRFGPRFGSEVLLGRSTHRLAEVEAARRDGADYVTFGPVYPTPGKERHGPPPGLDGLAAAARTGVPVYALGGVTLERLDEVAAAGAIGAAGIRLFGEPGALPRLVAAAAAAFGRP